MKQLPLLFSCSQTLTYPPSLLAHLAPCEVHQIPGAPPLAHPRLAGRCHQGRDELVLLHLVGKATYHHLFSKNNEREGRGGSGGEGGLCDQREKIGGGGPWYNIAAGSDDGPVESLM